MVTALYAAAAGLMLIALSFRVINQRRLRRVSVGAAGDPEVERAMRVQANFAEYAPMTLIMLGLAEMQGLPAWSAHLIGLSFFAGRLMHFAGFRSKEAPGVFRVAGMMATFGVLLVLAIILLAQTGGRLFG